MVNKRSQPYLHYGCPGPPRKGSGPGKKIVRIHSRDSRTQDGRRPQVP